jgi:hypothetical protein
MQRALPKSNEGDNRYRKMITVHDPADFPNLTPCKPSGWSDAVVISKVPGTRMETIGLTSGDVLYVDFAVCNRDTAPVGSFKAMLTIDERVVHRWVSQGIVEPEGTLSFDDYSPGSLNPGDHTFKIVIDDEEGIPESSEDDNQYTKTITVAQAKGSLTVILGPAEAISAGARWKVDNTDATVFCGSPSLVTRGS